MGAKIRFKTRTIPFWIKGAVMWDGDILSYYVPHALLGFIPIGHFGDTVSIQHITSADIYVTRKFLSFLVGLISLVAGLFPAWGYFFEWYGLIDPTGWIDKIKTPGESRFWTIILVTIFLLLLTGGIRKINNSWHCNLVFREASGKEHDIRFSIFDKRKCVKVREGIFEVIRERSADTNVRVNTEMAMNQQAYLQQMAMQQQSMLHMQQTNAIVGAIQQNEHGMAQQGGMYIQGPGQQAMIPQEIPPQMSSDGQQGIV